MGGNSDQEETSRSKMSLAKELKSAKVRSPYPFPFHPSRPSRDPIPNRERMTFREWEQYVGQSCPELFALGFAALHRDSVSSATVIHFTARWHQGSHMPANFSIPV
jgi:hypothetical protein